MDRNAYLRALYDALAELVPGQERAEILRYYEEYFDDAGPDGEAAVIEGLGDPQVLAQKLAAEAGYSVAAAPRKKARGNGWWVLIAALIVVGVLILGVCVFADRYAVVGPGEPGNQNVQTNQSVQESSGNGGGQQISVSSDAFTAVDVLAAVADVTIVPGEDYTVELFWDSKGAYSLNYKIVNGILRVTGSPAVTNDLTVKGASVVVTVPAGYKLEEVSVEVGLGNITLTDITVADTEADTGLGDIIWKGGLSADTELSTGMGDIHITVPYDLEEWSYELTTGMGDVTVNGENAGNSETQRGEAGELSANTGMGDIVLNCGG